MRNNTITDKEIDILYALQEGIELKSLSIVQGISRNAIYKKIKNLLRKGYLSKTDYRKGLKNYSKKGKFSLTNKGLEKLRLLGKKTIENKLNYCEICGYFKVTHLHHIDSNRKNNHRSNLIRLCPNHHYLIHQGKAYLTYINQELCYIIKIESKGKIIR